MNPLKHHQDLCQLCSLAALYQVLVLEVVTNGDPSGPLLHRHELLLSYPHVVPAYSGNETDAENSIRNSVMALCISQSDFNHPEPQTETLARDSCGDQERQMVTMRKVLVVGGLAQAAKHVGKGRLVLSDWE